MGLSRNLPKGLIHLWCGPWSLQTRFVTHPSLSHSPEPHTVQRTAPRYCQNQIPLHAVWQFLILHQLYSQCPTRTDTLRATGLIMVWLHFLQTILRRQIIHHGIYAWQQVWNVLLPNTNRWDLTNILHTIFTFSFLFFFRRRNRFQWRIYLHPPPPLASSDSHFPRDSQQHYKVFNNSLPLERRAMWDRISVASGPTGHFFILLQALADGNYSVTITGENCPSTASCYHATTPFFIVKSKFLLLLLTFLFINLNNLNRFQFEHFYLGRLFGSDCYNPSRQFHCIMEETSTTIKRWFK